MRLILPGSKEYGFTERALSQRLVTGPTDPFNANVVMRVHGNFIDTSLVANPFTVVQSGGLPFIDSANKVYGTESMGFDNAGSASCPFNAAWDLGGRSFTVNLWYRTTFFGNHGLFSTGGSAGIAVRLSFDNLQWMQNGNGSGSFNTAFSGYDGLWHHLEFSYDQSTNAMRVYIDGTRVRATSGATITAFDSSDFSLGLSPFGEKFKQGNIQDLLITADVVRNTGPTLTLPIAPYPDA